jgi:dephospho-CoA kinase
MTGKTKIVALTGGIGSGKSLIAGFFQSWGAAVVDADLLAREVVAPGSAGLEEVQKAFQPEQLILADGSLNRSKLAALIFSDQTYRHRLEAIVHPRIRQLWLQRLAELQRSEPAIIVYVVPLYFESANSMNEINKIVLVTAPDDIKVARIIKRDGFSQHAAELRLKAQLPDSEKIDKSDYVIYNSSTIESAKEQAQQVFASLLLD